ncbi:hypothetical protein KP79_PYT08970 [Mizuhopecten yessoensis]|uniref:Uncharacterized protein n=1 Tax=Mizuhopecten yessoensis TaxID=6573 RepID=A0A210PQ35_MIZYE|nr:hypothetical protein KP79_PYT08970 [Mizuhopecten yessoensis]
MPMSRKRAYVEIAKMASYMSFPFIVYVVANKQYVFDDIIDRKLKQLEDPDWKPSLAETELLDTHHPAMEFMIDLTRKVEDFFSPKKSE